MLSLVVGIYRKLVVGMMIVAVGSVMGFAPGLIGQAGAASGYPYGDKPCIWAPYNTHGTRANWCVDYDWGDQPNDLSPANVLSPYGYFYRNCTDYVAWKLDSLGVSPGQYKGLGNAKQWATPPSAKNVLVNDTPAVGAVGVRTTGKYGHLAFVEEVHSDGTVKVSQYNKGADGNYSDETNTPKAMGFTQFVHFEAFVPSPAAQPETPDMAEVSPNIIPDSPEVPASVTTEQDPPPPVVETAAVLAAATERTPTVQSESAADVEPMTAPAQSPDVEETAEAPPEPVALMTSPADQPPPTALLAASSPSPPDPQPPPPLVPQLPTVSFAPVSHVLQTTAKWYGVRPHDWTALHAGAIALLLSMGWQWRYSRNHSSK